MYDYEFERIKAQELEKSFIAIRAPVCWHSFPLRDRLRFTTVSAAVWRCASAAARDQHSS
ncbi:MAG: hypothetical protein ND866_18320 [Pyrinomonadaceae bacterium]|nr:hypothetical protein [Pyrinomonadaceae bacterium]